MSLPFPGSTLKCSASRYSPRPTETRTSTYFNSILSFWRHSAPASNRNLLCPQQSYPWLFFLPLLSLRHFSFLESAEPPAQALFADPHILKLHFRLLSLYGAMHKDLLFLRLCRTEVRRVVTTMLKWVETRLPDYLTHTKITQRKFSKERKAYMK